MSSVITADTCEICREETAEFISSQNDEIKQKCPRCGEFKITGSALTSLNRGIGNAKRAKLSGWVREQNRMGANPIISTHNLRRILERPLPPVTERANNLLIEAASNLETLDDIFNITESRFISATYSLNKNEVLYLITFLTEQNLIHQSSAEKYLITPYGFSQLESMRNDVTSSKGFVAMWFDPSLDTSYREGFERAILTAGYDPIRIDNVDHINKIDDEIIRQINASKFIVADFTGHRGGVYFEAGYAMGLNKPIFWTCRKDQMPELHFDIRQFNCIDWNSPDELADRLSKRIEAVIGPGPNKS